MLEQNPRLFIRLFFFAVFLIIPIEAISDIVLPREKIKELTPEEQKKKQEENDKWHRDYLRRNILLSIPVDGGVQFVFERNDENKGFISYAKRQVERTVFIGEKLLGIQDHHGGSSHQLVAASPGSYSIGYESSFSFGGKSSSSGGMIELAYSDPLFVSVYQGDVDNVKGLIESGTDIESKNAAGMTPFMLAAYAGQLEMMDALIELGADLEARQNDYKSVLYISRHCPRVFFNLLEQGFDPWVKKNKNEVSLLDSLEVKENTRMLSALLKHEGFEPVSELAKRNFLYALDHGPLYLIAAFIEAGVDVNSKWDRENHTYSFEQMKKFRDEGIDIRNLDDSETALERISRHKSQRRYHQDYEFWMISQFLVKTGADSSQYEASATQEDVTKYTKWIIKNAPVEDIAVLFKYGIFDVNSDIKTGTTITSVSADGTTTREEVAYPWLVYIESDEGRYYLKDIAQLRQILIDAGAGPLAVDQEKIDRLRVNEFISAVRYGNLDRINEFLEYGVDLNYKLRGDKTVLEYINSDKFELLNSDDITKKEVIAVIENFLETKNPDNKKPIINSRKERCAI